MREWISTLQNIADWLVLPSLAGGIVAAIIGGFFIMSGERSSQTGKRIIGGAILGLLIIHGGRAGLESLEGELAFMVLPLLQLFN